MAGALVGDVLGDLERWGIDAALPAFFLALLAARLGDDGEARRRPPPASSSPSPSCR